MNTIEEVIAASPNNKIIQESLIKVLERIGSHNKALVALSGGSDSDIMLDMIYQCGLLDRCDFIWFNTGLEYKATIDHLDYLDQKYGISIIRQRSYKSIPYCCNHYGQPFISKIASDYIHRLQQHNFTWIDGTLEELNAQFPGCQTALKWWCNESRSNLYNIDRNKYLKEFMMANPPDFNISNLCCEYSKKKASKYFRKASAQDYDLDCVGVRKAEGGARANIASCYTERADDIDSFRPVFWFDSEAKQVYQQHYGVVLSACYTEYNMRRTGCCGCPFGKDYLAELAVVDEHDPNLATAARHIFADSYRYTEAYKAFRKRMEDAEQAR